MRIKERLMTRWPLILFAIVVLTDTYRHWLNVYAMLMLCFLAIGLTMWLEYRRKRNSAEESRR